MVAEEDPKKIEYWCNKMCTMEADYQIESGDSKLSVEENQKLTEIAIDNITNPKDSKGKKVTSSGDRDKMYQSLYDCQDAMRKYLPAIQYCSELAVRVRAWIYQWAAEIETIQRRLGKKNKCEAPTE